MDTDTKIPIKFWNYLHKLYSADNLYFLSKSPY